MEQVNPARLEELRDRAALLAVGVESAETYLAQGEVIPEPLLAELTEYRQITRYLSRAAASDRHAEHRTHRREVRRQLARTFGPVTSTLLLEREEQAA
ncbi:hypothetical protein AVR91_0204190 [Amycolatopsis keratiniphila subsp. keratiniphila]|uniref:Uncharacterized protein n=1 Tax=Amycolatopsis keratiniphila subsp. keratiniphila TaxID=227715 RepID=A0A1W2M209_9PSEU|nr:hypothetical protein AVR91_0204190 [Amycolatopsis keratiniphila subsp. keratiniphila]